MSLPMNVICINDSNKPDVIPVNKWIVKNKKYTVIDVQQLNTKNQTGFLLAEIQLDESCFPYHYFNANRFVTEEFFHSKQHQEANLEYAID